MSIYNFLGSDIPTIAYINVHQPGEGVTRDEYVKTLQELHERIRTESAELTSSYMRSVDEAVARDAQGLQHMLSQFLQTPLRSDTGDVQRTLREALQRQQENILGTVRAGVQASTEGRYLLLTSKQPLERKLLKNGRRSLEELGFLTAKGTPDVYESMFLVRGGENLDVIEYLVREKLGIYATTHGKHITQFKSFVAAVYNLIFQLGEYPAAGTAQSWMELTLSFSKPDVKYAPFRKALGDALEKLRQNVPVRYLTLWQRKLALGRGREFQLRMMTDSSDAAGAVLNWLNGYDEPAFVKGSILGSGNLTVKEMLLV
jgi:hypothetical protein